MAALAIRQSGIESRVVGGERNADPVTIRELSPSPSLREFVRAYHYMEMDLGRASLVKPVTARPELMLQFSVRRPFRVIHRRSGVSYQAPDVVVVGRQTRRNVDLVATGQLTTMTVHFQPAGFHRLFHLPMPDLTDLAPDAVDVVGPEVSLLRERLAESECPEDMARNIELWLRSKIDRSRPYHPVQTVAQSFLRGQGATQLHAVAAESGLSLRQLERAFLEQVGIGPKRFRRIVRFAEALQAKSEQPRRTWAEVAAGAGYFDQMHFVRDCHSLGGDSPTALMQTWIDCRP